MASPEITRSSVGASVAAWMGYLVGPNAVLASTQGMFIEPLSQQFGWTRTAVSAVLLISPWTVAFSVPFAGRAMDRWGLRGVLLPGVILFGAMHMLISVTVTTWQFIAVYVLLSVAAAMHGSVGYAKLVSLWFAKLRGRVLGAVVALGSGLGATLGPQINLHLIADHGWRGGYFGLGLIILIIGFPVLYVFLREPTRPSGRAAAPHETFGLTWTEALRRPSFWYIILAVLLTSIALIGTIVHAFPMLTERGFSSEIAATAVSCMFIGSIIGQLGSGVLVDRFDTPRVALPTFVGGFLGFLTVHSATTTPVLLPGAVLLGVGLGSETALSAYFTSRYFGLRAFGILYAFMFGSASLGVGIGVLAMGYMHDVAGSYGPARAIFGLAMLGAIVSIALLGPYVYPSVRPGESVEELNAETKPAAG